MIHFGKDEVEVPSSKKLSKEKIIEIIKALHFCPILPSSSTKKKWSFTICPYKTLATFEEAFEIEKTKIAAVSFFSKKPFAGGILPNDINGFISSLVILHFI